MVPLGTKGHFFIYKKNRIKSIKGIRGIPVSEHADPNVIKDMLSGLYKAFLDKKERCHKKGNLFVPKNPSNFDLNKTVIIYCNEWLLRTCLVIYFCEFDGTRSCGLYIKLSRKIRFIKFSFI